MVNHDYIVLNSKVNNTMVVHLEKEVQNDATIVDKIVEDLNKKNAVKDKNLNALGLVMSIEENN